ncbi:hypothetical protein PghCCS26_43930 [Paenibacillus glycanilyticus]|uniref:Uncharacterized protein n=1 Tax=Paenibacillus glycanilyticus TaxID=126569 RepID=A0ABQ6NQA6_9BACL|nr:hypothetical protein PghCCS26_43930 [Paenibacillus glycanilyticus]
MIKSCYEDYAYEARIIAKDATILLDYAYEARITAKDATILFRRVCNGFSKVTGHAGYFAWSS